MICCVEPESDTVTPLKEAEYCDAVALVKLSVNDAEVDDVTLPD